MIEMADLVSVDESGRLVLPKKIRAKLGLPKGGVAELELRGSEALLRAVSRERSAAKLISEMRLPSGDWKRVEKEIADGAAVE